MSALLNWLGFKLATSDSCCNALKKWVLLHHRGSSVWQRKKEVNVDWVKREGKTLNHTASCLRKRKGVEASSLRPQSDSWDQCNIQHKVHWGGGVLSCSESTPVLQGSHHIVFTIVCGWGKKKKKRREQRRERKPVSLCRKDSAGKWSCDYLSLPAKQDFPPPDLKHHLVYSAPPSPCTRVTYECASQAGKQRHPGFSWWWELTSDWFPWILMWRIVCFIEEQKEARWLPFRIC